MRIQPMIVYALSIFFTFLISFSLFAQADLPTNAVAGKCYAKCLVPDQYETVTEQILLKEASTRIDIIPAEYETVEEQLLVKEGYKVLEIIPAVYGTVQEELLVKEASSRLEYIPPIFETVTEQVVAVPASTKWVKGKADRNCLNSNDPDACKVWCLQEIPAQFKTITRQVLKAPAHTRELPVPAEYKTITKTVVQTPAKTAEREVPPEYRSFTKQVLSKAATTVEREIPAEYTTLTTQKLNSMGGFTEWVEVLCEYKTSQATITDIQKALNKRGYPVIIDGILGAETRQALMKFQQDNGLPVGHGTNIMTLRALGVSF